MRNRTRAVIGFAAMTALWFGPAGATAADTPVSPKAVPFDLSAVRLLDGPFKMAEGRDADYLISLEPDRLLSRFRAECGLTAKAPVYGGWEDSGVAGHTLGHYLSACSLMYAATGDGRFKDRADYIVGQLAECQSHLGTGYVAAIPDWRNVFGNLKARHGAMIGWVPWYTVHKEMAGLRDAHLYCGNATAKDVLVKLAGWVGDTVAPLTDVEVQGMLEMEQGGMAETLADVSALTGDAKYMALAKRFTHRGVLDPLAAGRDRLDGLHANTQVPKLIGAARIYALTGDPYYDRASTFFWQAVVADRTWATGGNGDFEHFFPPAKAAAHLSACTAETCNVYNMLKLTKALFAERPTSAYADYYERAVFNQILGSQDPERGMVTYHQSLRPGGFKIYSNPTDSFWCCVGTGMENHARYGEAVYFHDRDSLWVNLFIASELTWADRGLTIRQETKFPDEPTTKLTVTAKRPTQLTLKLRVPAWVAGTPTVKVNGQPADARASDGYLSVGRLWATGDTVEYTTPMAVHTESLPGATDEVAFLYGPVVLAADLGTAGLEPVHFYSVGHDENFYANYPGIPVPALVGSPAGLAAAVKPVAGDPLTFRTDGVGRPGDLTLRPYSRTHFVRYTVYFKDYATAADYDRHQAEVAAAVDARRKLDARTADEVHVGDEQSEHDHGYAGKESRTGPHMDRRWRDAVGDGYFEYAVKLPADGKAVLMATYWGSDDGGRRFTIAVDGKPLATDELTGKHPGEFYDATYPIPAELTRGKSTVTVRFAPAAAGQTAGGVFGLRVLRGD